MVENPQSHGLDNQLTKQSWNINKEISQDYIKENNSHEDHGKKLKSFKIESGDVVIHHPGNDIGPDGRNRSKDKSKKNTGNIKIPLKGMAMASTRPNNFMSKLFFSSILLINCRHVNMFQNNVNA